MFDPNIIITSLSKIDPTPFFAISIIPYSLFLFWARKSSLIPRISFIGFCLTVLFVIITIIFAIIAKLYFGQELTNIDPLHGGAELFLTISDACIAYGFYLRLKEKQVNNS